MLVLKLCVVQNLTDKKGKQRIFAFKIEQQLSRYALFTRNFTKAPCSHTSTRMPQCLKTSISRR